MEIVTKSGSKETKNAKPTDTTPLRRSARVTPAASAATTSTTNVVPTPSRKSARNDKTSSTPSKAETSSVRRSERLEKATTPLRRSERGKKQSPEKDKKQSPEKDKKHSNKKCPLDGKAKKKKSVNQLTKEAPKIGKKRGRDSRVYRAMFQLDVSNVDVPSGRSKRVKLSDEDKKNSVGDQSSDNVNEADVEKSRDESDKEMRNVSDSDSRVGELESDPSKSSPLSPKDGSTKEWSGVSSPESDPSEIKESESSLSSPREENAERGSGVGKHEEVVDCAWLSNDMITDSVQNDDVANVSCDLLPEAPKSDNVAQENMVPDDAANANKATIIDVVDSGASPSHETKENPDLEDCAPSVKTRRPSDSKKQEVLQNNRDAVKDKENIAEPTQCQLNSPRLQECSEKCLKDTTSDHKSELLGFLEYWVPVPLSSVQLEQYCAILLSKSFFLRSSSKSDTVEAVHDVILSTRKCCDHPYFMDSTLQQFLAQESKDPAFLLDVGIKASGKLHFLDVMLSQIKDRNLKVLILFKSSGGSPNIGDILDDFVRQRFSADSYERIDEGVLVSKKRSAINNFNNQKGRFVFLLETRACNRNMKLSVDTVIIYNSDLNPLNDIRNLQRLILDKQVEQLKVFRLFTSYTVEENTLILAKRDKTLESSLTNISRETSHLMLMPGSLELFNKLDEFHTCAIPACSGSTLREEKLPKQIIDDFFTVLPRSSTDSNRFDSSLIFQAKHKEGSCGYITNLALPSELKAQSTNAELPHFFWRKLLEGREPRWRYPSGMFQLKRRRTQQPDDLLRNLADDGVEVKKLKKSSSSKIDRSSKPVRGNIAVDHEKDTLRAPATTETTNLHESQESLHLHLKPQIAKLCDVLKLAEDVKIMAEEFFEYVMKNHHVTSDPETILQAFQISVCWNAASFLDIKLDHNESLALAKKHLHFRCKRKQANIVYSFLRCLKTMFLLDTGKLSVPGSEELSKSAKDLVDDYDGDERVFLSRLGVARNDYLKSIKYIKKKCQKQMEKLQQEQHEEKENLKKKYEEDKAQLEKEKKTEELLISVYSISMKADKLKQLDIEYSKKFEILKSELERHLEDHESSSLAAKDKLQEEEARWLEFLKTWAQDELMRKPTSDEATHNHEPSTSKSNSKPEKNNELEVAETFGSKDEENADKTTPNGENQSSELRVNRQSGVFPSEVTETAPVELQEGVNNDLHRMSTSPVRRGVIQQNRVNLPGLSDAVFEESVRDNDNGREMDRGQACEITNQVSQSNIVNQQDCGVDVGSTAATPCLVEGSKTYKDTDEFVPSDTVALSDKQDEAPLPRVSDTVSDALIGRVNNGNLRGEVNGACVIDGHAGGSQQDGVGSTNNQNVHPQALQDEHVVMAAELQDGGASGTENRSPLPQLETAVNVEPRVPQSQLSRNPDCSSSYNMEEIPSGGAVTSLSNREPHTGNSSSLFPTIQLVESPDVLQPVAQNSSMQLPPSMWDTSVSDLRRTISAIGVSNHPTQMDKDPLQNELERIRKQANQTINAYEETKKQIKVNCEKEIEKAVAQIRFIYEKTLQQVESEFQVKKNEIDAKHNKVLLNKFLAEAFRSKCTDVKASSTPTIGKEMGTSFMQQFHQVLSPAAAQRPSVATSKSTAGTPAGRLQAAASSTLPAVTPRTTPYRQTIPPSSAGAPARSSNVAVSSVPPAATAHTTTPYSQTFSRPSAVNPGSSPGSSPHVAESTAPPAVTPQTPAPFRQNVPPPRPLQINSISLATGSPQVGSEFRAPAPHLQPYRPPAAMLTTDGSSLSRVTPSKMVTNNPVSNSPAGSQLQQETPVQSTQDGTLQQTPAAGFLPRLPRQSQSAMELLMDVHNQASGNTVLPDGSTPLNDMISSLEELIQHSNNNVISSKAAETCPTGLVCLSDDE